MKRWPIKNGERVAVHGITTDVRSVGQAIQVGRVEVAVCFPHGLYPSYGRVFAYGENIVPVDLIVRQTLDVRCVCLRPIGHAFPCPLAVDREDGQSHRKD